MSEAPKGKSKMIAGILCIIPACGIGNMYLGFWGKGIAQLLLCCLCVGSLWSLYDGIMILMGKVDKDAAGNPLV